MKKTLVSILILLNIVIIMRLFYLCVFKSDYYDEILSENENFMIEGMSAPRGRILDVYGNILVDNIGVKSLIYNKLNLKTSDELKIAEILADNLEVSVNISDYNLKYYYYLTNKNEIDELVPDEILRLYRERKLTSSELLLEKLELITKEMLSEVDKKAAYIYYLMNNGFSYQDKIIKTNLTEEEYIIVNSLNLPGIRTDITWERVYPYGNVLRDVFGDVSTYKQGLPIEYKEEYLKRGYKLDDRVGTSNLEYIYDDYLRGSKAKYKVNNNILEQVENYERGKDIVLSIDINLQLEIEEILEKEMINAKKSFNSKYFSESYVVVSNPSSGNIIALIGKKINDDHTFVDYSYYNVINAYNMGSSVKGATISVGYKNGIIDENTRVYDSCLKLAGQKAKCSWTNLGLLDDINALRMSSNYFQYLIAVGVTNQKYRSNMRLGATIDHFNEYRNTLKDFGLGNITGIDLSKESTGMKSSTITDDLLLNMAVGHYDTYTPISMVQYINTIAMGERRQLSLLKSVLNNDGSLAFNKENTVYNKVPIDNKYLTRIREGLRAVNKSGTGYSYTNQKFASAGKTGTSDSYLDTDLDGIIDTFTTSTSYVMYFPYDKPEYSIAIVSPHLSYKNNSSNYRYPINMRVIKEVTDLIYND